MFAIEKYAKAGSVAEAVRLLAMDGSARLIAGGTDVLVKLREGHEGYSSIVDIHGLAELRGISLEGDGSLRLGAGVTFTDLMESELVASRAPMLCEMSAMVAGPQIRNVATIGGNIANGAVSADSVPPLLVLDASLEIAGPTGVRSTPLLGFHTGPGRVALERGEVLTAVIVPQAPGGARGGEDGQAGTGSAVAPGQAGDGGAGFGAHYIKYAAREAMDIAATCCAASALVENGRFTFIRLAYGVAAPTPVRCPAAEGAAKGQPATAATLDAVKRAVEADVKPRTSWRAPADFRLHVIREMAARALAEAARKAGWAIGNPGGSR
jgi:xanthine dehydrogenase FAD-binding subunit